MIGRDQGDGSMERTRRAAAEAGVASRVEIVPGVPKDEVPGELERGSIFLNTADIDNTPVSVLEAMACGLCVVSTDAGGIPHLVRHGVDGLITGRGDAAGMAASVRRLLHTPELAARLSANARARAEQLDWALLLPQWEALFEAAAGLP
jgi:glycosyltransferase involved in cell wall biosynthesis